MDLDYSLCFCVAMIRLPNAFISLFNQTSHNRLNTTFATNCVCVCARAKKHVHAHVFTGNSPKMESASSSSREFPQRTAAFSTSTHRTPLCHAFISFQSFFLPDLVPPQPRRVRTCCVPPQNRFLVRPVARSARMSDPPRTGRVLNRTSDK